MCDPGTLLATSLALSAASTAATVSAQRQQAKSQAQYQQEMVKANNAETSIQLSQLRIQQSESRESVAREGEKARLASQRAKASATAAAADAGATGASVDALLQEYSVNLGQFKEASLRQSQLDDRAYGDKATAIASGAKYQNLQINAPIAKPNYAAAGLQFASQAMGAYRDYNPGAFQKKP